MSVILYSLAALLSLAALYGIVRGVVTLRDYLRLRGKRLVICPETQAAVGVELAAGELAVAQSSRLRLRECSRWPERAGCGQECLAQIEAAPDGCLVRNLVTDWYAGKSCALCHRPIPPIDWLQHKPAVLDSERRSLPWDEVAVERLPEVLATCRPVCWNCHIAESFRTDHPELVVERKRTKAS